MAPVLLAHILIDGKERKEQTLREHCIHTAEYAAGILKCVKLSACGYLCGILHDAGKAWAEWQDYLQASINEEQTSTVNHTFAAVRFLICTYHNSEGFGPYGPWTAEILAYSVGFHHGLFDGIDSNHNSGLLHRIEKPNIGYDEAMEKFFTYCFPRETIDTLFAEAAEEVQAFIESGIADLLENEREGESYFYMSLLIRLIASATMAGDRQDTAEFMSGSVFPKQMSRDACSNLWASCLKRVEKKLEELENRTPIQKARGRISEQCKEFADNQGGVIRLNVPTGSGKTLSSLRYALAHGKIWGKERIIFTAPLLSILDQNSKEIRRYIQDDSLILEHHSNVVRLKEEDEKLDEVELLMETWESPVIITTLLQLLNTMFSGKTSCIRRFHTLCNSIIIIDEVQTVPTHLLSLFNLTISFLAQACNTTIVLCSATQPHSDLAVHPITADISTMVPYDEMLWNTFRRTKIRDEGAMDLDEIAAFSSEMLEQANSILIICNQKKQARKVFKAISEGISRKFYLSADMCMAHRREVFDQLKEALLPEKEEKVICVSTQVIEAGVDISFERVVRFAAGMDSVVQAAGRCNRNGRSPLPAPVAIVRCNGESLAHLPDILRGKNASHELLLAFKENPGAFKEDLASEEAIKAYYSFLYANERENQGLQDGLVTVNGKQTTLYSLLSLNHEFMENDEGIFFINQAFKTAGKYFTVFDTDTLDVLVPYKEGANILAELDKTRLPYDWKKITELLGRMKPYTVSMYRWQWEKLYNAGDILSYCEGHIFALRKEVYSMELGVLASDNQSTYREG